MFSLLQIQRTTNRGQREKNWKKVKGGEENEGRGNMWSENRAKEGWESKIRVEIIFSIWKLGGTERSGLTNI